MTRILENYLSSTQYQSNDSRLDKIKSTSNAVVRGFLSFKFSKTSKKLPAYENPMIDKKEMNYHRGVQQHNTKMSRSEKFFFVKQPKGASLN